MKVIISLVVGLLGGIAFSVAYPDLALNINGQREKLMNEGKEQALSLLKQKLDEKISTAPASSGSGAKPNGFAGFAAGGGGTSGKSESDTLKETKAIVEAQLAEVKAKK